MSLGDQVQQSRTEIGALSSKVRPAERTSRLEIVEADLADRGRSEGLFEGAEHTSFI
jgi:hypothetical protein